MVTRNNTDYAADVIMIEKDVAALPTPPVINTGNPTTPVDPEPTITCDGALQYVDVWLQLGGNRPPNTVLEFTLNGTKKVVPVDPETNGQYAFESLLNQFPELTYERVDEISKYRIFNAVNANSRIKLWAHGDNNASVDGSYHFDIESNPTAGITEKSVSYCCLAPHQGQVDPPYITCVGATASTYLAMYMQGPPPAGFGFEVQEGDGAWVNLNEYQLNPNALIKFVAIDPEDPHVPPTAPDGYVLADGVRFVSVNEASTTKFAMRVIGADNIKIAFYGNPAATTEVAEEVRACFAIGSPPSSIDVMVVSDNTDPLNGRAISINGTVSNVAVGATVNLKFVNMESMQEYTASTTVGSNNQFSGTYDLSSIMFGDTAPYPYNKLFECRASAVDKSGNPVNNYTSFSLSPSLTVNAIDLTQTDKSIVSGTTLNMPIGMNVDLAVFSPTAQDEQMTNVPLIPTLTKTVQTTSDGSFSTIMDLRDVAGYLTVRATPQTNWKVVEDSSSYNNLLKPYQVGVDSLLGFNPDPYKQLVLNGSNGNVLAVSNFTLTRINKLGAIRVVAKPPLPTINDYYDKAICNNGVYHLITRTYGDASKPAKLYRMNDNGSVNDFNTWTEVSLSSTLRHALVGKTLNGRGMFLATDGRLFWYYNQTWQSALITTVSDFSGDDPFADIVYANGVYCAFFRGKIYTSSDLLNWTDRGAFEYIFALGASNDKFVLAGFNGIYVSSDGITWENKKSDYNPGSQINYGAVYYGNGKLVIHPKGTGATTAAYSTDNGVTWSTSQYGGSTGIPNLILSDLTYCVGGYWLAISLYQPPSPNISQALLGNGIYRSDDGVTNWTAVTGCIYSQGIGPNLMLYDTNSTGIFAARDDTIILYSADRTTFDKDLSCSVEVARCGVKVPGQDTLIMGSYNGKIIVTKNIATNGLSNVNTQYVKCPYPVQYLNAQVIGTTIYLVGSYTPSSGNDTGAITVISYTNDGGTTWTHDKLPDGHLLYTTNENKIVVGTGKTILRIRNSRFMKKENGVWEVYVIPEMATLTNSDTIRMAFGNGVFVVYSETDRGTIWVGTPIDPFNQTGDLTWVQTQTEFNGSGSTSSEGGLVYDPVDGQFFLAAGNKIYQSIDGSTWNVKYTLTNPNGTLKRLLIDGDRLVAISMSNFSGNIFLNSIASSTRGSSFNTWAESADLNLPFYASNVADRMAFNQFYAKQGPYYFIVLGNLSTGAGISGSVALITKDFVNYYAHWLNYPASEAGYSTTGIVQYDSSLVQLLRLKHVGNNSFNVNTLAISNNYLSASKPLNVRFPHPNAGGLDGVETSSFARDALAHYLQNVSPHANKYEWFKYNMRNYSSANSATRWACEILQVLYTSYPDYVSLYKSYYMPLILTTQTGNEFGLFDQAFIDSMNASNFIITATSSWNGTPLLNLSLNGDNLKNGNKDGFADKAFIYGGRLIIPIRAFNVAMPKDSEVDLAVRIQCTIDGFITDRTVNLKYSMSYTNA